MGVGPGDEVIVPDITWIATVAPVLYLGATPIFADVDPVTWCIAPTSVEQCLSKRTKAIIGVDLYGGMCDWARLKGLARTANVKLIEDAAEAVGSSWMSQRAGSFADVGTFSFHGSKTMTTGEGGMLVTNDGDLLARILRLRDHGRAPNDFFFENEELGFKYRMSAVQAAMGLGQLSRLQQFLDKKRRIFSLYAEYLTGLEGITLNAEPAGLYNSYWMSTVVWDDSYDILKKAVMARLAARGIDSRPFFNPLSSLPALANIASTRPAREQNKTAYALSERAINLPSALCLEDDDVLWAACVLRAALESNRRSPVSSIACSVAPGAGAMPSVAKGDMPSRSAA
jgi:perosamine synthetase